jgi:hypothetical protein
MAEQDQTVGGTRDTAGKDFLLAEYKGLIDIDISRNDRLDRYLTLFLSLAAAPWALFTFLARDGKVSLYTLPLPVAVVFLGTGLLGFLVTMMFIQVRFNIILYMRAMNAIRGHFAAVEQIPQGALRLPTSPAGPHYNEQGSYIFLALLGMALVNSAYLGLGVCQLNAWPNSPFCPIACVLLGCLYLWCHVAYYRKQARQREERDRGGLTFDPSKSPRP